MKIRSGTKAAVLYLLPAFSIATVWYILLFVAKETVTPGYMLKFVLVDDPMRLWYWWTLMIALVWLGLAAAYLTRAATMRRGAAALLGIGVSVAIGAWLTLTPSVAIFATLPLLYSFRCARDAYRVQVA